MLGDELKDFDPKHQNHDDRRHAHLQEVVLQLQWGKGAHDLDQTQENHRHAEGVAVALIAFTAARHVHPIYGDVKNGHP